MATSPPAASPAPRRLGSRLTLEVALAVSVAVAFADSSIVVLALPGSTSTSDVHPGHLVGGHGIQRRRRRRLARASAARAPRPSGAARPRRAPHLPRLLRRLRRRRRPRDLLIGGRVAQGVGAALLLGASLPLFVAIGDRRERAIDLDCRGHARNRRRAGAERRAHRGVRLACDLCRAGAPRSGGNRGRARLARAGSLRRRRSPSASRSAPRSGSSSPSPRSWAPSSSLSCSSSPSGATARSPARRSWRAAAGALAVRARSRADFRAQPTSPAAPCCSPRACSRSRFCRRATRPMRSLRSRWQAPGSGSLRRSPGRPCPTTAR